MILDIIGKRRHILTTAIPSKIINLISSIDNFVERVLIMKEIAGSQLIQGVKK